VDVHVVAVDAFKSDPSAPDFDSSVLGDVPHELISFEDAHSAATVQSLVQRCDPDAVAIGGWMFKGYASLFKNKNFHGLPLLLCSDNPFVGSWRQKLGYWRVRPILRRADRVVVTGQRGVRLMKYWNVPSDKIRKGLYGIDFESISVDSKNRAVKNWPNRFLFVGRMDERKGIDRLIEAYKIYRGKVDLPWELRCVGKGPLVDLASSTEGVVHTPMLPPDKIPTEMTSAGAFVICSRFDCWPLVIVEACSAALPVIATPECGSTDELLKHTKSGLLLNPDAVPEAIADALLKIHQTPRATLAEWGRTGQELAQPYSSSNWAKRWHSMIAEVAS
jgi:glycosyltransferase involved in cell wall biosynthesis